MSAMASSAYVETLRTDRTAQVKFMLTAALSLTGFIVFCIEATKSNTSSNSHKYYVTGQNMKERLLPAATVCPTTTDTMYQIASIECKYYKRWMPGHQFPDTEVVEAVPKSVTVDLADGFPLEYNCYSINPQQKFMSKNFSQNIMCALKFDHVFETEVIHDQARVTFFDAKTKDAYPNTEPNAPYGWSTLDPAKHQEFYLSSKAFFAPKMHAVALEVTRGNWRRYNLTAIREDPQDNVMLSFDFAYNQMFEEEYKALKYPYESSNAFFGTFGGFLFFLIMLYYMLYGAAAAVLGLDRAPVGGSAGFGGGYDASGSYSAGPSSGGGGGLLVRGGRGCLRAAERARGAVHSSRAAEWRRWLRLHLSHSCRDLGVTMWAE
ncbi:hypothetical protein NFJ02_11g08060 [Pycnococcus provasolii]